MATTTMDIHAPVKVTIEDLIVGHARAIELAIGQYVESARSEGDIRHEFARLLHNFISAANVKVAARHEYGLAGGRIDTKYGGVILEYKNPNSPDRIDPKLSAASTKRLVGQIETRFEDFERAERIEQKRLFGCGTDGRYIIYIRNRTGRFEVEAPQPLTVATIDRLLRAIVSLGASGNSFTPDNLCGDFGAASSVAKLTIAALYRAISETDDTKAHILFEQWRLLFTEVCGYKVDQPNAAVEELARSYNIKNSDTPRFLFALHTYYSIFIKLLGSEIVSAFSPFTASVIQRCVQAPSLAVLKREMTTLEKGSNWKAWGVSNFLEGDLFAWYLSAWNNDLAQALRALAAKADEYDPSTLSVDPSESQDLLKKLYQHLIPKNVRHDLGEYYTPDWLASRVINLVKFDGDPNTRVLDPACGSGTFLVETINRVKRWFDANRHECGFSEETLIQKILQNVVGFDLNPLAVLTSRVNYLIAIRDLIKHSSQIELPIYLSDSVLTPTEFGALFTNMARLKTAAGEFIIPAEVSRSSAYIAKYTEIMELCIEDGIKVHVFLQSCTDAGLPMEDQKEHAELYAKMQKLSLENRNGIWARVIKNSFAPIFAEKFDLVVGNPPWINWQHLPKGYRTDLLRAWRRYGLLTLTGADAGLGGSKKDLSMLFTYVAVDQYLKTSGRLAFLITQSVFKTKGAGDGFRRLRFSDGAATIYLRPLIVEDLSAVQVFDGATNRTAVAVFEKSTKPFSYPVDVRIWCSGRRIPQDADPDYVEKTAVTIEAVAEPVILGQLSSPWLTVPKGTLAACRKVLGKSSYRAMAGCTTWLNGVYWVEILKRQGDHLVIRNLHDIGKTTGLDQLEARIESKFVFPLLRGEGVSRWKTECTTYSIVPQDPVERIGFPEEELQRKAPLTFSFLKKFEKSLRARSGFKKYFKSEGPFYSIYNISEATFAPHKVVWRDMGSRIQAAVVSLGDDDEIIVPEHHVMFVPARSADEAHFLCGLLNSAPVALAVAAYTTTTGMSTHVASVIALPKYSRNDGDHKALGDLARKCAKATKPEELSSLEKDIDIVAARIFSISANELSNVHRALH